MRILISEPQTLELETTGSFVVGPANDETSRCGPINTPRLMSYRVRIVTSPRHLDARGFVIDWQDVALWFDATFGRAVDVFPSCERIAVQACEGLCGLLNGRASEIDVTVGAGGVPSGMRAMWRAPVARTRSRSRSPSSSRGA